MYKLLKLMLLLGVLLILTVVVKFGQRIYQVLNPPVNHILFWVGDDDVHSKLNARLSKGADVHQKNIYGRSLIHLAAQYGTPESLMLLINENADVSARNNLGQSALHFAVDGGSTKNIKILLQNGADVNAMDNFQISPLHRAVSLGASGFTNGESVTLLLSAGANVHARTQQEETPLHWASTSYYVTQNLLPLLKAGASPNVINKRDESPLHLASKSGSEVAVKILLDHRAEASIRDMNGKTALDYALTLPKPFSANIMEKLNSNAIK